MISRRFLTPRVNSFFNYQVRYKSGPPGFFFPIQPFRGTQVLPKKADMVPDQRELAENPDLATSAQMQGYYHDHDAPESLLEVDRKNHPFFQPPSTKFKAFPEDKRMNVYNKPMDVPPALLQIQDEFPVDMIVKNSKNSLVHSPLLEYSYKGPYDQYDPDTSAKRRLFGNIFMVFAMLVLGPFTLYAIWLHHVHLYGNPAGITSFRSLFVLRYLFGKYRSRFVGFLASLYIPSGLRYPLYYSFSRMYGVNIDECRYPLDTYKTFDDFFSRHIRFEDCRVIESYNPLDVVSPVDAKVVNVGSFPASGLEIQRVSQIKGATYNLRGLLGEDIYSASFTGAHNENSQLNYVVLYLAPGDYHRFHSPTSWEVQRARHIHGEVLPVFESLASRVNDIFTVNERLVLTGRWAMGMMHYVAVAAYNVGGMSLVQSLDPHQKLNTNSLRRQYWYLGSDLQDRFYRQKFSHGDEIGSFHMGSTIVLIFESSSNFKFSVDIGHTIKSILSDIRYCPMAAKIIFATTSPRRKSIISTNCDLTPLYISSGFEENFPKDSFENPADMVLFYAQRKAEEGAKNADAAPLDIIIGVDTIVVLEDTADIKEFKDQRSLDGSIILEKPHCTDEALKMLRLLRSRPHYVLSGVSIYRGGIHEMCFVEKTMVYFRQDVSDDSLMGYVSSGDSFDKSGGYGIQGKGAFLVERIDGDYYNIVGLPISKLLHELAKL